MKADSFKCTLQIAAWLTTSLPSACGALLAQPTCKHFSRTLFAYSVLLEQDSVSQYLIFILLILHATVIKFVYYMAFHLSDQ